MRIRRIPAAKRPAYVFVCLVGLGLAGSAAAAGAPQGQGQFAAAKQAAARNQAALRQYTWVETTQLTYNGDVKNTKVQSVSYGPDGQLVKTELSQDAAKKPPGLRGMIAAKKGEDMTAELESASVLVHSYIPPSPDKLQAAVAAGNMQMSPAPPGVATLVFANYQLPGDALTLTLIPEAMQIETIDVSTWLDNPSKVVTLVVQFQSLPDATNYPATTTLTIPSSKVQVTITNANYQKLAQ